MPTVVQLIMGVVAATVAVYYSGKGPLILRKTNEVLHGKPGCNPVASVGNVTLHYFQGRGRGEPIRLLMEEAGIAYHELNFNKDTWPKFKKEGLKSGLYTFGQVPAVTTESGVNMAQSQVILHYLARSVGMDCDCEHLHTCETIALGSEDARSKLSKLIYDPDYTLQDRETYLKETMPMWLGYFEKLAPALSEQDPFFSSGRMTWADFLVFDLIENNLSFAEYDFKAPGLYQVDVLEEFPKLKHFYSQMLARTNVKTYIDSSRRHPYKIANQPKDIKAQSQK